MKVHYTIIWVGMKGSILQDPNIFNTIIEAREFASSYLLGEGKDYLKEYIIGSVYISP